MSYVLSSLAVQNHLKTLNQTSVVDWRIHNDKLRTQIEFASFKEAFAFMTAVAKAAESLDHHPDWQNSYNQVYIQLTTHSAGGLTELDFELAKLISDAARYWAKDLRVACCG